MLRKTLTTLVTALVLPLSAPGPAWADSPDPTVDEMMQQVEWLQVQMTSLLQQIESIKQESDEAAAQAAAAAGATADLEERTTYLEEDVEDLDDRLMVPERHAGLDRVLFTGDFRVQAHSIDADFDDWVDGLGVQGDIVNTLFFFGGTGNLPQDFDEVEGAG